MNPFHLTENRKIIAYENILGQNIVSVYLVNTLLYLFMICMWHIFENILKDKNHIIGYTDIHRDCKKGINIVILLTDAPHKLSKF